MTVSLDSPLLSIFSLFTWTENSWIGTQYFKNFDIEDPFLVITVILCVKIAGMMAGVSAFFKYGRRPVLFWGAIGMFLSQLVVAIIGTAEGNFIVKHLPARTIPVDFVCIFVFLFGSTWGCFAR